jgi:HK97 family phage portal protein
MVAKTPGRQKKSAPTEEKSVAYSLRYGNYDGTILDGQKIARNNAQFYKMYRVNTDIRRAIKEKQETSMKSGYEIRRKLKDWQEEVVEAPEFEGAMDRSWGIYKLKNDIVKMLDLFGYAFIRRVYNIRNIKKYEVLDWRFVSVVTDSDLVPVRYIYKNPAQKGKTENYDAEDIITIKNDDDLDNPVFGISPLETIVIDVLGDEEANLSNYAYFQNDGIPSALYVLQAGLSADDQRKIYDQIQETLKGGHNKHKSLASSAITDVKPITNGHTDMSFENQRSTATVKVCVALGVPRSILGYIDDVNYSNGDVQYKKFIENTIRPLEETIEHVFTIFLQDFPDYVWWEFEINDEHIDDFQQRAKIAIDNVNAWLWTRNEARDYIGYEVLDDELADEITVPTNSRLLSDLVNGSTPEVIWTATNANPQTGKSTEVEVKIKHHKK